MSPSSHSATRPALADLADLVHQASHKVRGNVLVTIREQDHVQSLGVGCWPIPATVAHPADPLISFLAPPSWSALGLSCTGLLHQSDPEPGSAPTSDLAVPLPIRATVVRNRLGGAASLIETDGGHVRRIDDVPEGWVSDALARALGLPTPDPADSVALAVEATWIDRIAGLVLDQPGTIRRWDVLARLHPLAPSGAALPGRLLAEQSLALARETSWRRTRLRQAGNLVPRREARPPGGQVVAAAQWFDDGSFSRWAQRNLPPAGPLLAAVVDALPAALAAELRQALTAVGCEGATNGRPARADHP